MNIQINEKIRITSDAHNFTIEVLSGKQWKPKAHYSRFESLLKGLSNEMLRRSAAESVQELAVECGKINRLLATIADSIRPVAPTHAPAGSTL